MGVRHPRQMEPEARITATEREAQVVALRRVRTPYSEIGRLLDITPQAAHKAFERALRKRPAPQVDALRAEASAELDTMFGWVAQHAARPQPVVRNGKVVEYEQTLADGSKKMVPLINVRLLNETVGQLLAIHESHRRLHGLDAAKKYEIAGPEGGPIEVEAQRAKTIEAITARVREIRPPTMADLAEPDPAAVVAPEGDAGAQAG